MFEVWCRTDRRAPSRVLARFASEEAATAYANGTRSQCPRWKVWIVTPGRVRL